MLSINSPGEVAQLLAERLRQRRLANNWGREELSRRSGVTVASIRRFETQAEISLGRLLQLCMTLRVLEDFEHVLAAPEPRSIAEIEKSIKKKKRQRARKKAS